MDKTTKISLPCYTKDGKYYIVDCVFDTSEIRIFCITEEVTKSTGETEFKPTIFLPPDSDVLCAVETVIRKVSDELSKPMEVG